MTRLARILAAIGAGLSPRPFALSLVTMILAALIWAVEGVDATRIGDLVAGLGLGVLVGWFTPRTWPR